MSEDTATATKKHIPMSNLGRGLEEDLREDMLNIFIYMNTLDQPGGKVKKSEGEFKTREKTEKPRLYIAGAMR